MYVLAHFEDTWGHVIIAPFWIGQRSPHGFHEVTWYRFRFVKFLSTLHESHEVTWYRLKFEKIHFETCMNPKRSRGIEVFIKFSNLI